MPKSIDERIRDGEFANALPWGRDPKVRVAYQAEENRLHALFANEALTDVGLLGHPKADKAFALAYDRGHAHGYHEIHQELRALAELLLD